jgi:hypothetical protein
MSVLFMESWDHYAQVDILKKWSAGGVGPPGISAGVGRRGTKAYASQIIPLSNIYKAFTPGDTKCLAAGAFRFDTLTAINPNCFSVQDGGTDRFTSQVVVFVTLGGEIAVYRGANTMTHLATTSGAGITGGVYFHLSVEIVIHPSTGSVKLAVNGVTMIDSGPVLNTRYTANTQWNGIRVGGENTTGGGSTSSYCYVDDIIIGDGVGGTTLFPDLNIDAHFPNADGTSSMSTPSGSPPGTRYDNVNEAIPNTAPDDYNTLAAVNDKDTFGMQNLAIPGSSIHAVQTLLYAKKTDSGLATMKPVIRSGGNEHDGTEVGLSTSLNYYRQVFEQNPIAGGPATPGPWTETDFNAAEFGYKRIS